MKFIDNGCDKDSKCIQTYIYIKKKEKNTSFV